LKHLSHEQTSEKIYKFSVLSSNFAEDEISVESKTVRDGFRLRRDGLKVSLIFKSTIGKLQRKVCQKYTTFPCLPRQQEFPQSECPTAMEFLGRNETLVSFFCPRKNKIFLFNNKAKTYSVLPFQGTPFLIETSLTLYLKPTEEFDLPLLPGVDFLKLYIDNSELESVSNFPKLADVTVSFYSFVTIVYETSSNLYFSSAEGLRKIAESTKHVDYAFSNTSTIVRFLI